MSYTWRIVQVDYVDAAVYNCVLDVCMNNAETELAESIFQAWSAHVWHRLCTLHTTHCESQSQEMVQKEVVTLVTYNTSGTYSRNDMLYIS